MLNENRTRPAATKRHARISLTTTATTSKRIHGDKSTTQRKNRCALSLVIAVESSCADFLKFDIIGSNANWSFGLPMGAAPGLQNHQQRNIGSMGTFAQSLGGSQPATPLDLSYVFLDTFWLSESGQNRWLIFVVLVNSRRYQEDPSKIRLSPLLRQYGRMQDSGRPSKHRFQDNNPPRASLRREPPKPKHTSPSNNLPKRTYFHLALNSQTD